MTFKNYHIKNCSIWNISLQSYIKYYENNYEMMNTKIILKLILYSHINIIEYFSLKTNHFIL